MEISFRHLYMNQIRTNKLTILESLYACISSAQSKNLYNSGIVLHIKGIFTLLHDSIIVIYSYRTAESKLQDLHITVSRSGNWKNDSICVFPWSICHRKFVKMTGTRFLCSYIKRWRHCRLHVPCYIQLFLLCPDSHFRHEQFRKFLAQGKNSYLMQQSRNFCLA